MKRLALVTSVCAAVLVAGCGPRMAPDPVSVAETEATGPMDAQSEVAAAPTETGETAPGAAATQAPTQPSADGGQPEPKSSPPNGSRHNNGAITIQLSSTCVRPGDILVVTLRTPPRAGLGMVIGYSDNQPHGAMLTGQSDDNGVYVWRVPVEPTVPDGEATVLVTATGADWSEGGGTADKKFQVARAGC